jgi:hypothetical protein
VAKLTLPEHGMPAAVAKQVRERRRTTVLLPWHAPCHMSSGTAMT